MAEDPIMQTMTFGDLCDRVLALYASPGDNEEAEAAQLVNDGYLHFLRAHDWSFMRVADTLTLWPSLSVSATTVTGVYDVQAGITTLTASAASFYGEMVDHEITITDIGTFAIQGYTSATVITLTGDATCEDATFSVAANGRYSLPDDFGGFCEDPILADSITGQVGLEQRTPEWVLSHVYGSGRMTDSPRFYAVRAVDFDAEDGQRWELLVYPWPSAERTAVIAYRPEIALLSAPTEYPRGGSAHSLTILQAALMLWEQRKGEVGGVQHALFYGAPGRGQKGMLQMSIEADQRMRAAILGNYGRGPSDPNGQPRWKRPSWPA